MDWSSAFDAGIVQALSSFEELPEMALKKAEELCLWQPIEKLWTSKRDVIW